MLWLWLKELLLNDAGDHSCPDCFAALSQGEPLALLQRNITNKSQGQLSVVSWHHHLLSFWQLERGRGEGERGEGVGEGVGEGEGGGGGEGKRERGEEREKGRKEREGKRKRERGRRGIPLKVVHTQEERKTYSHFHACSDIGCPSEELRCVVVDKGSVSSSLLLLEDVHLQSRHRQCLMYSRHHYTE